MFSLPCRHPAGPMGHERQLTIRPQNIILAITHMLNDKLCLNLPDRCEVRSSDQRKVAAAKAKLLGDDTYASVAETFSALGDSNRSKIVYSLLDQELCVCDMASVVGISESAVSQHLRILRTLRLVRQRKDGRMMYYSLNDEHIRKLLGVCLEHVQHG